MAIKYCSYSFRGNYNRGMVSERDFSGTWENIVDTNV